MFERFSDRARRVVVLAQEEARRLSHGHIGTEHILLGLTRESDGVAARALESLGISLDAVRQQVEQTVGQGQQAPSGYIPFTPRAKKVLELSLREALQLSHNYIGTEHILLGLTRESDGVAAQVLVKLGADLNTVRQRTVDLLHRHSASKTRPPDQSRDDTPLRRWAQAHVLSLPRRDADDTRHPCTDAELRATVAGMPLLARVGIAVPLALLLDLVHLTGGAVPADGRLRTLASQAGIIRLRALAWPSAARVALAGLLVCDVPPNTEFAAPNATMFELRDALAAVHGGADGSSQSLVADDGRGWQAGSEVFDALCASAAQVTGLTISMLEILGSAAAAAEPTLPLRIRHRISSLPRIGAHNRRLIMESLAISTPRNDVAAMAFESASGTSGVSRHGKVTGLLPAQFALPEELLEYRYADRELLYRVSETATQSPPEPVTIVLDTTPATYGPPEVILRLVAHVIGVTMWAAHKTAALVTLDHPGLARQIAVPADLVAVWTARSLEPPDIQAGLSTARRLGAPAIVLTQHHAARDLPVVPHRDVRLLTTHVADDLPPQAVRSPFHVHLPPNPTAAQVVKAVRDVLEPDLSRTIS